MMILLLAVWLLDGYRFGGGAVIQVNLGPAGIDCSSLSFMVDFAPRRVRKPEPVATAASDSCGGKIFKEPLKSSQEISQ
jgi:hypothetical protein